MNNKTAHVDIILIHTKNATGLIFFLWYLISSINILATGSEG